MTIEFDGRLTEKDGFQIINVEAPTEQKSYFISSGNKILCGDFKIEVSETEITLTGFLSDKDQLNFRLPKKTKNSDGKWEAVPVEVSLDKPICFIFQKDMTWGFGEYKKTGEISVDFPIFYEIFSYLKEKSLEIVSLKLPLTMGVYADFYESRKGLKPAGFNEPDDDWEELTREKSKQLPDGSVATLPPRVIASRLASGERIEKIKSLKAPSATSGNWSSKGETEIEKLQSRMSFLDSNWDKLAESAKKIGIDPIAYISIVMKG